MKEVFERTKEASQVMIKLIEAVDSVFRNNMFSFTPEEVKIIGKLRFAYLNFERMINNKANTEKEDGK